MLGILAAVAIGVLTVGSYNVLNESEHSGTSGQADTNVVQTVPLQQQTRHPMLMQDLN